ncbi:NaeI family type II restriction endonuclease [Streptomyces sp. NWU49]|uniref:NaeI family type II restriction endonuclease n=1 Tax=Streptomyces sp. NWU49 TaxID=2201153 RepID=UPI001C633720
MRRTLINKSRDGTVTAYGHYPRRLHIKPSPAAPSHVRARSSGEPGAATAPRTCERPLPVLGYLKPAPRIAEDLDLPTPSKGSWVSAKLTLVSTGDDRRTTLIDGLRYGLWREGDLCVEAPLIET